MQFTYTRGNAVLRLTCARTIYGPTRGRLRRISEELGSFANDDTDHSLSAKNVLHWVCGKTEERGKYRPRVRASEGGFCTELGASMPTGFGDGGGRDATNTDWLFDFLLSVFKSPEWDIAVMGFIDQNCAVFDTEEENKLSYTALHHQFKELVS